MPGEPIQGAPDSPRLIWQLIVGLPCWLAHCSRSKLFAVDRKIDARTVPLCCDCHADRADTMRYAFRLDVIVIGDLITNQTPELCSASYLGRRHWATVTASHFKANRLCFGVDDRLYPSSLPRLRR